MSPPELSTNAPVSNIIEPLEPGLFVFGRNNLQFSIANRVRGSLGHAVAVDVPLRSDHGFQNISRAGTDTQSHFIGLFSFQKTLLFQSLFHGNTSIVSHHPFKLLSSMMVDTSIFIQDGDKFQIVSFAAFVIIRIMGGGNLDGTGTKRHVDQFGIGNNGNFASTKGMNDEFAVQMSVPRIFRMHCDGRVSQHGLQTCRRDDELFALSQ
mmetsp:Transcript_113724/g.317616  ORF Transcript_113724/g.317616 Transcript_113724/m.317616 type:complete len:208 (-) Transcript_113724:465-1088(-)